MPTSTPRVETGSNPTLDCFTGAIVLREGAGAVGSSYLRDCPSASTSSSTPTPTSLHTPTSIQTPTRPSEPPPYFARQPVLRAASPVAITLRHTSRPRRPPTGARAAGGVRGRPLPWKAVSTFALGATLAALAGLFGNDGGLDVAALAAVVAGVVTLKVALARRAVQRAARHRTAQGQFACRNRR